MRTPDDFIPWTMIFRVILLSVLGNLIFVLAALTVVEHFCS